MNNLWVPPRAIGYSVGAISPALTASVKCLQLTFCRHISRAHVLGSVVAQ
jgi:hypothetical protein